MKLIEVICKEGDMATIIGIAEHFEVYDFRMAAPGEDGRQSLRMLVTDDNRQAVMDALQGALTNSEAANIIVIPVDLVLPRKEEEGKAEKSKIATREELYNNVASGARLDGNYLLLVILSTIVAAIGLVENNVAVVIGAMVIAPLLGPNIALALATALGDTQLSLASLRSLFAGLGLAILLAMGIGWLWPLPFHSQELLSRTVVGMDSIALAFASGAAAVLSLTTGLSSVLVGVMVAVALLPPAATIGLMLSNHHYDLAAGATLLLAANIVSVNLAAKLVLLYRGVKPRTWLEKKKAKQSMWQYILFWLISLLIISAIIYYKII